MTDESARAPGGPSLITDLAGQPSPSRCGECLSDPFMGVHPADLRVHHGSTFRSPVT